MENYRDIETIRAIRNELQGNRSKEANRIRESLIKDIDDHMGELKVLKILLEGDLE